MATIYDVAALAKVSPKTVSRVLNGDAPVGRETREAIKAAIAALGYVPSNAARMMRSQKSGLVGLITGAISLSNEPSQPQGLPELFIVQGIQRALAATPMTLMIADTGGHLDRVPDLIQTFLRHRVQGLIYVAEFHQKVELPRVPDATPFVLANCFDGFDTPSVLPDDQRGQRELVERVIAAGHRRIAYLTLPPHMVATNLRTAGYFEALAKAGIPADPALIQCADYEGREDETQILWDIIDRLVQLPEPPTVLCCGNDKMAMRVYGILRSRGVKVPDEMSVAGYDNYRVIAEALYPPLTTVDLSYTAIGVRAAQQLMAMISHPDKAQGLDHRTPTLVSGPVYWRGSVMEHHAHSISKLRIVRED